MRGSDVKGMSDSGLLTQYAEQISQSKVVIELEFKFLSHCFSICLWNRFWNLNLISELCLKYEFQQKIRSKFEVIIEYILDSA